MLREASANTLLAAGIDISSLHRGGATPCRRLRPSEAIHQNQKLTAVLQFCTATLPMARKPLAFRNTHELQIHPCRARWQRLRILQESLLMHVISHEVQRERLCRLQSRAGVGKWWCRKSIRQHQYRQRN